MLAASLLLVVDVDPPTGPAASPNNLALPSATQDALLPPAAPPAAPPSTSTSILPPAPPRVLAPSAPPPGATPNPTLPAAPQAPVAMPPSLAPGVSSGPGLPGQRPASTLPTGIVTSSVTAQDETCNVTTGPWPHPVTDASPMKIVWGELDVKAFPDAGRMAPNGIAYCPLFSLDLDMNVWLWPRHGLYVFGYARFWGERGTPGQTQGNFDYTRREFNLTTGAAWNYYGNLELRFVGYSRENLNRGVSLIAPGGTTNDGAGVEQRLYLSSEYAKLGQDGYNVSRSPFVSVGYFPTKSLVGADGEQFHPGAFARAYLTWDVPTTYTYLFLDLMLYCDKSFTPRRLDSDVGVAFAPFEAIRMLEFRLGSEFNTGFTSGGVRNMSLPYLSIRLNY
jgi:hypothetical protein